jgi:ATP-dependent helicase HrpB
VACDMEQRRTGSRAHTIIRQASAVEPDWILELYFDRVKETREIGFNDARGRVEARRRILYENLVVEDSPDGRPDEAQMARALFEAAWSRGWSLFDPDGKLEAWLGRAEFAARHAGGEDFPVFDETLIRQVLTDWCRGKRSLKDLASGNVVRFFESRLTAGQARALASLAPERIALRSKKKLRVFYGRGREPYGAGRIQDFFGMRKGPALAGGKVPLVLHLLAPNGRAVQVTTDLEGFWKRHYPSIAKELRRRYPRHAWPDKPA